MRRLEWTIGIVCATSMMVACGATEEQPWGTGVGGKGEVAQSADRLSELYLEALKDGAAAQRLSAPPQSVDTVLPGFYTVTPIHRWPNEACPELPGARGATYAVKQGSAGMVPASDETYDIHRPELAPEQDLFASFRSPGSVGGRCQPLYGPLFHCPMLADSKFSCSSGGYTMKERGEGKIVTWTYAYEGIEGTWLTADEGVILNRGVTASSSCEGPRCQALDTRPPCTRTRTVSKVQRSGSFDECLTNN